MRRGARRCADQQPRLSQRMDTVKETLAKRQAPYAQDVCAHRENTANGPEASGSRAAGPGERAGRPGWASGLGEREPGSGVGRAGSGQRGPATRRVCAFPTFEVSQTLEKRTLDFRDTTVLWDDAFSARRFCGMSFLRDGASTRWRFRSTPLLQRDGSAEWRALEPRFPTLPHQKSPAPQRGTGLHAHE